MGSQAEWQTAAKKRGRRGRTVNPSIAALAKELTLALRPESHRTQQRGGGTQQGGAAVVRKPEWACKQCSTDNFMDRIHCRRCGGDRTSASVGGSKPPALASRQAVPASGQRLPSGSVWANPDAKTPAARAAALEKAAAAARAAGASEDAARALVADAEAAKREAVSSKPLGARIDSARARLRRAESRMTSSREALEKAQFAHAEACSQRDAANTELEALERECLQHGSVAQDGRLTEVLEGAKELLLKLEGSRIVDPGTQEPPESILSAMRALQAAIAGAVPEPELTMTLRGEEAPRRDASIAAAPSVSSAAVAEAAYRGGVAKLPTDAVTEGMPAGTIAGVPAAVLEVGAEDMDLEDAALGALMRERLQKRQRSTPY